jgi:hypothetical protein
MAITPSTLGDEMSKSKTKTKATLTLGDRVALAAALTAIHQLPLVMQQASNAHDMGEMLIDPARCWRAGYILAQARHICESYTDGWISALDDDENNLSADHVREIEKFINRVIEHHKQEADDDNAVWDQGVLVELAA